MCATSALRTYHTRTIGWRYDTLPYDLDAGGLAERAIVPCPPLTKLLVPAPISDKVKLSNVCYSYFITVAVYYCNLINSLFTIIIPNISLLLNLLHIMDL